MLYPATAPLGGYFGRNTALGQNWQLNKVRPPLEDVAWYAIKPQPLGQAVVVFQPTVRAADGAVRKALGRHCEAEVHEGLSR